MPAAWVAAFFALALLVFLLALLVLGTLRRLTPLLVQTEARLAQAARPSGLAVGAHVPSFEIADSNGQVVTEEDLYGSQTVLVFLGRSCPACEPLIDALRAGHAGELSARLVLVASNASEAAELAAAGVSVLVQEDHALSRLFESDRVPHAFVIDADGRIAGTGSPNGWAELVNLVADAEEGGDRDSNTPAGVVRT